MPANFRVLFADRARPLAHQRGWNIAFRTAHLAATGILLGGHFFDVPEARLRTFLYLSIATGLGLVGLEAYPSLRWFYQGRGVMVISKLALLCAVPFFWAYRAWILLAIVFIASIGSHMSSKYRYYSFVHGRVLDHRKPD